MTVQLVTFLVVLALVAVVTVAVRGTLDAPLLLLPRRCSSRCSAFVLGLALVVIGPARLLPRRRADPRRGAAAVVLRLADLLRARRHHRSDGDVARDALRGPTRWRRSSRRCATSSTTARWPRRGDARLRARRARRSRCVGGRALFRRWSASWRWSCERRARGGRRSSTRRARSRARRPGRHAEGARARPPRAAGPPPVHALDDVSLRVAPGETRRDRRPQRRRQDLDAARARRDRAARRGPRRVRRPRRLAARARRRLRARLHRPREHPAQRRAARADARRRSRRGSTTSSPSPSSATSSTCR